MKKINLAVVLISSFLFSCGNSEKVEISKEEYNKLKDIKEIKLGKFIYGETDELRVVDIDSCEYIIGNSLYNKDAFMTHKGNCKFCAKRK